MKIKAALLGYGFLGKWHAQKLAVMPDVEFSVVVEPNAATHAEITKLYPQVKIFSKIEGCLDLFDAAVVASPTIYHAENVDFLLRHNKHVFCEKPLSHSGASAQELEQLSICNAQLVAQVGHSERCHEIFEASRDQWQKITQGLVTFTRQGAFKGRALDVSCVEDIMVHDLDLMLYLFSVKNLSCRAWGVKSKSPHWDSVRAHFYTDNNLTFEFFVSRDAVEEVRKMEIYHSSGTTSVDFLNLTYTTTHETLKKTSYPKRDHLLFEQQMFFASIRSKKPAWVNFKDGSKVCRLVDIVLEALKKGTEIKAISIE